MTKECLTFAELNEFSSPGSRVCAVGCSRKYNCLKNSCELCNCPTYSKKLCYTRVISKLNGKQQALLVSRRRKCKPCPGKPSTRCNHCV